jgi:micrococcal nuclease
MYHLPRRLASTSALLALCLALLPLAPAHAAAGSEQELQVPTELYEITRVVDGDTIYVLRDGEVEKLRLLSVDTEEKLAGNSNLGPNKPETVFGEECAQWAVDFFAARAGEDGPARVGLKFPAGVEARDIYGRLLCHVILDDGTDFNLLLVEKGKSPYFNKYGNSRVCHQGMSLA